jgi:hypothetical protein
MRGDTRKERVKVKIKYSHELSEDVSPEPGTAQPVISPEEFIRVKQRHINRIFCFLIVSSMICLTVAALRPIPEVLVTVGAVWAGLCETARRQLARAQWH